MNPASRPKVGTACRGHGDGASTVYLLPLAVLAVLGLLGCALSEETTASESRHVPPGWDRWFGFSGYLNCPDSYDVNSDGRPRTIPRQQNETDLLRDVAANFIKRHRDEPWMTVVATHAPHGPYWPPGRHENRFDGVKLPRTPAFDEDNVSNKPEAYRRPPLSDQEKRKLCRA